MKLVFIVYICFLFGDNSDLANNFELSKKKKQDLMRSYYQNKKEFILLLNNGEKYKISEVLNINQLDESYDLNILNKKFSETVFYKKNISKVSSYKDYHKRASIIMNVELEDIMSIESINYDAQIKEARIYTFIILGMYLVFSAF
mgnify:CR=1 FL=1|tara:strand:+ start:32 stop:466 length:435 start_codon:yes stop_codon:yes gene_type:complete